MGEIVEQVVDHRSGRSVLSPTTTLTWTFFGADDGIRTRDPHLGKVMLYQLSHVRLFPGDSSNVRHRAHWTPEAAGSVPEGPIAWHVQAQWPRLRTAALTSSAKASDTRWASRSTSGTSSRHPRIPKYKVPS